MRTPIVLSLLLLAHAPPDASAGDVAGTVTTKQKPTTKAHTVTKDHGVCGKHVGDESLIVSDGKLANAVVFVENPPKAKVDTGPANLDQRGCVFVPHVQAATTGSTLVIKNSDATLHNVHAYLDGKETLFNLAMPIKNQSLKQTLDDEGLVSIKCDAGHGWMSAYVYVFGHPFHAVTGKDGRFEIKGLPPGSYRLTVWHETLGKKTVPVTVKAGAPARADIDL